ncbi:MAG TPA: tetratricopeptide repeat protein [Xanthobacteraceae bacterium]|nr:tetratricopeptide repeat protein [Xanthobacteraceae bacterium]
MSRNRTPPLDPRTDPRFLKALRGLEEAVQCQQAGRHDEADKLYARVIKKNPDYFDALNLYGLFNYQQGRLPRAAEFLRKAVKLNPRSVSALNNLGIVLCNLKRPQEALEAFDRALLLGPDHVHSLNNRGNALLDLRRPAEALSAFESALNLQPALVIGYVNCGRALLQLGRYEAALANYDRALTFAPFEPDLHNNRGGALKKLNRLPEALACFERVIALKSGHAEAHYNRAKVLSELGRHDQAVAGYEAALSLEPRHREARIGRLQSRLHLCDWTDFAADVAHLRESILSGIPVSPFDALAVLSSPREQFECAKLFGSVECPAPMSPPLPRATTHGRERMRVAYLSADFRDHPISFLMAGVFEQHDRGRFETIGVSFNRAPQSEMHQRISGSFDHFIDAEGKSDFEVASLLKEHDIDLAIDLMGYTRSSRPGILAQRPAPVQINYLGFPATMGAGFIDYILADRRVIPEALRQFYSEKIAYLPDVFQANDSRRPSDGRLPSRSEAGLPEAGFVYCSFNNSQKITPAIFDVWMRLLRDVERSVLWLLGSGAQVERNLRLEAERRGVDGQRLIFASRVSYADYLARYRLADLFLDTWPFNAGATASDALWAGLPVVTVAGEAFASRMAASLVHSIGMSRLIADSLEGYERLARDLGCDSALMAATKTELARNRFLSPLFDTSRFTRYLEDAYAAMHARSRAGLSPEDLVVPP